MLQRETARPANEEKTTDFYVVGIGASAGGLEAINELFDNMPHDTGFAFVVVQHLSPDHRSLMPELLSKHTSMTVLEAQTNTKLRPNTIFVLPPKKIITLENGFLKLEEKVRDHHPNNAIDIFFESLARDSKERSVGIILSGTGTDGTRGIQAIKKSGGIVLVQDPISAGFDGMPNSAITTGIADLILSPEMMPDELIDFLHEAPLIRSFNALSSQEEALIADILSLVYKITQYDFSHYKRPTITRRLAKRMAEKNIKTLREYYNHIVNNTEEAKALCQEFLINVTRFFRDEEAFEILEKKVIPKILANREPGENVKIWVVAVSTGEEAYSIGMLCEEYLERNKIHNLNLKIFASDIDQAAIETGSKGLYTEDAVSALSEQRISRFFIKEGNNYRIIPAIRKLVVFARHDIAKDPPFSQIDLLTCRNMLIYMNPILQRSILQKLHFALKENGYLFLGPSENLGIIKDVMEEVEKKWKIYKCISKTRTGDYESFMNPEKIGLPQVPLLPRSKNAFHHLSEIFKDTLLDENDYAGILVDQDLEVKQAMGNFKKYISFPEGNFNFNLVKLVPSDLAVMISTSVRKAVKESTTVIQKRIRIRLGNQDMHVDLIVKPYLQQKTYMQPFIFIVLKESEAERIAQKAPTSDFDPNSSRILELEDELKTTKENLQAVIEEVESANEELQSSNEEIVSSNEELQSTNEELQSLNEELHTVNAEHQSKIRELIELNDDLNNYLNNTDVGQIQVDRNLVIRKFTPIATKQVNLKELDIGRSLSDISTNFRNLDLVGEIRKVMESRDVSTKEISMNDEDVFRMRIAPYIRQNGTYDGVVINFVNISELKRINSMLEAVLNSSTSGILAKKALRDKDGKIYDFEYTLVNDSAYSMLDLGQRELVGKTMLKSFPEMEPGYFNKYVEVVEKGISLQFEFYNKTLNRWYDVVCVKMLDGLVTTFSNITEKKRAADMLRKGFEDLKVTSSKLEASNLELEKSNFDLMQFASVASHDLKEPLRKIQAYGNIFKDKVKTKLEDKEQDYLNKVINAAQRMQGLVDDILTLSKLSNSKTPYEKTDLNKIISRILDDLEITIAEKDATIRVDDLPTIQGVPGQMHQLFQNLIVNALKFCEKDPKVRIYEKKLTKEISSHYKLNGDFHCIVVEDNGIGFEEQYAEKIFGIFQRLNGANFPGTGIGLAICKKIVENHGGQIFAESKPGKGAKFFILLPAAQ